MGYWIVQTFNAITFSMVLFLIAAGLSLIFGLMHIINLTHGCFYVLSAYVAISLISATNSFILALILGTVAAGMLGIFLQRFFLHRFQQDHQSQVLLTIGFVFIISDLCFVVWGADPKILTKPVLFKGSIAIGEILFPKYNFLIIAIGILFAFGLWVFQVRTKMGAIIRAGVDDAEMASGLGINVRVLFILIFGLGAAISGLGGVIAGPFLGVYPGVEWEILLLALAVILIGGMGSLKGVFIGSLLVGFVDNFCKVWIPELGLFLIYGSVAIVLAFRPDGLFGRT